jgi:hypothetical protein
MNRYSRFQILTGIAISAALLVGATPAQAGTHHRTTISRVRALERQNAKLTRDLRRIDRLVTQMMARTDVLRDMFSCFQSIDARIPGHAAQGPDGPDTGRMFAAFDVPNLAAPTYYIATYHVRTLEGRNCLNPDPISEGFKDPLYLHGFVLPWQVCNADSMCHNEP